MGKSFFSLFRFTRTVLKTVCDNNYMNLNFFFVNLFFILHWHCLHLPIDGMRLNVFIQEVKDREEEEDFFWMFNDDEQGLVK